MIDSVQSFRVVLADGRIVTASQNSHSNLFYALKGAGQNFGIVLETIFKTHDDPTPDGLYYTVDMTFNAKQLESVLMVINRIIPGQPGELALILLISAGDPSVIIIHEVLLGERLNLPSLQLPLQLQSTLCGQALGKGGLNTHKCSMKYSQVPTKNP